MAITTTGGANGYHRRESFFEEVAIWKEAPILIGTTKFTPLPDVKNIMVTGGAGFIACWLVRHLTLTYPDAYNIISFDKLDYCSSLNNTRVLNDKRNFTFYQGDITNPSEVVACLERFNIDTIIHFAAQSHVDLSFGNSYSFTHSNVYGTHVLLESAKKFNIRRFIHISTDEVYGEVRDDDDDLLETSILAPTNPYAATKAAAEMLVHSYQKSYKLPAIIVRSNNVYGPHQYPEKIIPKFTCLLNRSQPMVLHGDGSPTRRYLYAGDAADALDTILHRGALGQIYNVPSSDEISNRALCSRLLAEMDLDGTAADPSRWIKYTHDRPFNDHRYAVDGSKLRRLGWEQKTPFADGLRATVQWYRVFGERWWGDISKVLCPFPVVDGLEVHSDREDVSDVPQPKRLPAATGAGATGFVEADGVNAVNGTNAMNGVNAVNLASGKKGVNGTKGENGANGVDKEKKPAESGKVPDQTSLNGEPKLDGERELDDEHIERLIARQGAVSLVRQLTRDLAKRDAHIATLQLRADERERAFRKIVLGCGVSNLDLETKLRAAEEDAMAARRGDGESGAELDGEDGP